MKKSFLVAILASSFVSAPLLANFDNVTFNGFGSIIATKVLSGDNNDYFEEYYLTQKECPCFITDYYTGGLVTEDDGFILKNESKIGLQMRVDMTDELSFTTQLVARTIKNELSLEWAYLTYQYNENWSLQVGRKRIPMYYFSTFQDVGLAYTWVRPPQALYGWEASNYNGANISYSTNIGDIIILASAFTGSEVVTEGGYNTLYTEDLSAIDDSKWDNLKGFDVEISYEWFNARFVYQTSENYTSSKLDGIYNFSGSPADQRVLGLAINGDFDTWFFHLEKSENQRETKEDDKLVKAPVSMVSLGYRMGKWTPFISWSKYSEKSDSPNYQGEKERFITKSFTLRYDVNSQNALKVQIESFDDESEYDFVGDTDVLSISYDFVF
jgi:hypothetical protein